MFLSAILLFFLYSPSLSLGSSNAISQYQLQNDTLSTCLVLSDGSLLIGTTSHIIKLNSDSLTVSSSLPLNTTTNQLLLLLNDTGFTQNILSCQEQECFLLNPNDLSTVSVSTSPSPSTFLFPTTPDMPGFYTEGRNFFVGKDADFTTASSISKLRYSSSGSQLQITLVGSQQERNIEFRRNFLTNFQQNEFVYYVFVLPGLSSQLQIARVCSNDTGIEEDSMLVLTTYTEAELKCNGVMTPDSVTAATFVQYNGESMIMVSMRSASTNIICAFNVSEINTKMDDKLSMCKDGVGTLSLKRNGGGDGCRNVEPSQKNAITVCNRPGRFISTLEVNTPTSGVRVAFTSQVFSLNSLAYKDIVYLYAGSHQTIEQFYFDANNSLIPIRNITLATNEQVDKIGFSSDSEYLYIQSESYVVKRPVNVCNSFTSCDSCVESGDPICGWCVLSSSCTKSDDCTTTPAIWQKTTSNCPRINDVSPSVIYTDQLLMPNTLPMLSLNVSNIPNVTSYSCVYNFGSEVMPNTTTPASFDSQNETVKCDVPLSSQLPGFNGQDTILSVVSLTANGSTIISLTSEQQISFTNCSITSSCSSCLSTRQTCNWCPFDNNCISPHSSCQGSLSGTAIDNCPLIRSPRNNLTNYLVHVNFLQSLVIEANNLDVYSDRNAYTVECILKDSQENELYVLSATVGARNVTCDRLEFNVSLDDQTQLYESTLEVRVTFSNKRIMIDNLNNSKVIFYSCSLMGENCGQCLSIESKFECGYCKDSDSCMPAKLTNCQQRLQGIGAVNQCERPLITDFSPIAGPIRGGTNITIEGTNLGADVIQVTSIFIGSVKCEHLTSQYMPGKRIVCKTGPTETGVITEKISINFSFADDTVNSSRPFQFLLPNLNSGEPADPAVGPISGGTHVVIKGVNLGIGNERLITLAGKPCAIQREDEIQYNATQLRCISQRSLSTTTRGQGKVTLVIDGSEIDAIGFDYENDPIYESITPHFFFKSGGTNFTVNGQDLNIIQHPRLIVYYQSTNATTKSSHSNQILSDVCKAETTRMTCIAPALRINATDVRIGLLMDNVTELLDVNFTLTLHPDPSFATGFNDELRPGEIKNLIFRSDVGTVFYFEMNQVKVNLDHIPCTVENKTETTVTCEVEIPSTASSSDQYSVRVTVGNYNQEIGVVTITTPPSLLIIVGPPFAAFVIIIIVIFMVLFSVFYHKYRQKDEQNDRLVFELERLESSVAYECKLGFAELQTDLGELVGDLTGTRLPYHNLHSYLLQSLFPGSKDHPTLHPPQLPSSKKERMETGIRMFYGLLMDKIVLLNIVHTLEAQKQFNIRDKSNFGSLLMIALHNRLDYATEILKRLLSDLVRRTVAESYPKLLLRRTESVAEKMLSSWLAFTLHGYVVEHTGQPLYLLYKAVKAQLEKGPIDVITGEARYSLSEQKLVRQQLDIQVINATIETEDGLKIPVKLIDCDSISQAKEKMLDAVYKNAPVSQRPQLSSIDIEYRLSPSETHILRDEDGTNVYEYGWRRINTLRHYHVHDRATFRLLPRKEIPGPGRAFDYTGSLMVSHGHRTRTLSDAEDGTRIWHLFKQADEDPHSVFTNKKMVTEIYLPRMLSTKTILQQFVDDLFNSIFTLSHPPISPSYLYTPVATTFANAGGQLMYAPGSESLPLAIKYIFDLLDDEAMCAKISDTDVVHTWKNNALALRFWVNLIKNPEFVFDINKSAIVDSCLSVIAQAFIDGCSSSDTRPTINSPTSKLLYNKEVQDYKNSVKLFYEEIQALPRIPDEIMMQHLKEMSAHQAELFQKSHNEFNIESAAYEILRYATKYQQQILQSLRASGLEAKAQIFESVLQYTM